MIFQEKAQDRGPGGGVRGQSGMALLQIMVYGAMIATIGYLVAEMQAQSAKSQTRLTNKTSSVDLYNEMSLAIINSANQLATQTEP